MAQDTSRKQFGDLAKEWKALLACARQPPDPDTAASSFSKVSWPALLDLAEQHGVMQLLIVAAQKLPAALVPSEIRSTLAERQREQALFTLRMSAELFRITDLFASNGLAMLAIKGPALAMQAYGDPAMRNYGDLDFLVRQTDIPRATQLMMNAGYTPHIPLSAIAAEKIPGQYIFRRPEARLLVELHNDRTMRYYPRALPIEQLFARRAGVRIDGREIPALAVEDHLMLICVHGAKHFWERSQWIADVAALISRHPELRWSLLAESARTAGAETMVRSGLLLANHVLGMPVKPEILASAESDPAARAMREQASRWLPGAGEHAPGLLSRARFRMLMGGGSVAGASYLWRLLFSATEEDWDAEADAPQKFLDVVKRPFRLAKKHGVSGKD